jgi:DNA-binding NarL/FixJ family response regulator
MDGRPGVLTPQQAKVVKLLAEGLSNQQIGARMWTSAHTVHSTMRRAADRLLLERVDRGAIVHEAWWAGDIGDRPELLAEIEQLRAENEKLRDELACTPSDHRIP